MTYEKFTTEYARLFHIMMQYHCDQAGSNIYAGKMADLCEEYPEFEERYDEQFA